MLKSRQKVVVPNFKEILEDLGYKFSFNGGKELRTSAVYRNGKNSNSVIVSEDGFYDFGESRKGSIIDLVCLTTGIDYDEFPYLSELKERNPKVELTQYLNTPHYYSEDILKRLSPSYNYFESRGISKKTQKLFECGVASEGKMRNRIVFPIRDEKSRIIGFSGRILGEHNNNTPYPKWLNIGLKRFFIYNLLLSAESAKTEGVIVVVESIGDLLSFYEVGIKNVFCTFGLKIHKALLQFILQNRLGVVVAFNNDERQQGNKAAEKAKESLEKYMNSENISINLPANIEDWNDVLLRDKNELLNWYKGLSLTNL